MVQVFPTRPNLKHFRLKWKRVSGIPAGPHVQLQPKPTVGTGSRFGHARPTGWAVNHLLETLPTSYLGAEVTTLKLLSWVLIRPWEE